MRLQRHVLLITGRIDRSDIDPSSSLSPSPPTSLPLSMTRLHGENVTPSTSHAPPPPSPGIRPELLTFRHTHSVPARSLAPVAGHTQTFQACPAWRLHTLILTEHWVMNLTIKQYRAAQVTGNKQDRAAPVTGNKQYRAAQVTGNKQDRAAQVTGNKQDRAAQVIGNKQYRAAQVIGNKQLIITHKEDGRRS